jgi:hypothetical protein
MYWLMLILSFVLATVSGSRQADGEALRTQTALSHPEEIEWTWEVRPTHADTKLPNVLLVGDSITRNYYPAVVRRLEGVANVYLFASSTSLGDPRLLRQLAEFWAMEGVQFQIVHLSNGLHGWGYSEQEYGAALPSFLAELRHVSPASTLVWSTITPIKADQAGGATRSRIDARNKIASKFFEQHGIRIDDQHGLMLLHQDTYQDAVHFNESGSAFQAEQAAQIIRSMLARRGSGMR